MNIHKLAEDQVSAYMPKWHPMEDAPKDGEHILVVEAGQYVPIKVFWSYGWHTSDDFYGNIVPNPIAWTYLPVYKS